MTVDLKISFVTESFFLLCFWRGVSVNVQRMSRIAAFVCLLAFCGQPLLAQGIFATLTGVVSDPTGAVVPNAKIVLTDALSGSARDTVADADGYYTFASVPVGTYNLAVSAGGFQDYAATNISLGGGERRNVNVALTVGSASQTVSVNAQNTALAVTDSGERSFSLGTKELENFTQVGSNAAEYIKIVPGFSIQNGTQNKANFTGQTIGINANGDSGSQSPLNAASAYNGLPVNSLDIVADGAHVSDPGCNCDTPVNPNSDFLQEFKVLTSNFSAEDQKGPVVITSVTKAGGNQFHGSAFITARNHVLNSNDWLNNNSGVKQPGDEFYYPGGTIGGPIIIPGTRFNKDRNKLFFFAGFEYYYQLLDTGLLRATVPTASELGGDFSPESIAAEGGGGVLGSTGKLPGQLTSAAVAKFGGTTQLSPCTGPANGACLDPNMLALAKLFPAPNANPLTTAGYNYTQSEIFNQNNRQFVIRGDYNISEATKVFVRYNYQRELQQFPVGLWWRQTNQVPYPTPIEGKNKSDSWSGSITHVFNATMTNETVVAYTFVGFPNVFADPAKIARSNVGYAYKGLFNNGVAQIPSFGGDYNGIGSEAALVFNPGGFEDGGSQGLYANKYMPSISDTFTKVKGDHTIKAGFFYEWIRNAQPANDLTNGQITVNAGNSFSYGNEYADLLTGNMAEYQETNKNRVNDIHYGTTEFFVQDSWKVNKKLTVELGIRFTHFQPWEDALGFGYSIFDLAQFAPGCAGAPTYCGFEWHAKDSSVPVSGFPTRALFYQPRVGAAYDVSGNGFTVVRGGWGRFYYHSGQFTNGLDASAGVASSTLMPSNWVGSTGCPTNPSQGSALFTAYLSCLNLAATPAAPSAVDSTDNKQPFTDGWSVNVDQQTPFQGLMEVSYVGNRSRDLQNSSAGGAGSNINLVPYGSMLTAPNPATANANLYRPLQGYGDLNLATNDLYSNYNALQVSWVRHSGRYVIQANYTFQKAMGIVSPTIDPFNLHANYGALSDDRRNLFNAAYSIDAGTLVHSNHLVNGVVNGWQFSGITQLESGSNLTYGGNGFTTGALHGQWSASYTCQATTAETAAGIKCLQSAAIIPGSVSTVNPTGIAITNQSILGTSSQDLNPLVTCATGIRGGGRAHQFVNGNCLAPPTVPGQNGPTLMPAVYGPAYFDSDLSVFKNFSMGESRTVQIRAQAYNFLNHPLYSFPSGGSNLNLNFVQDPQTQVITQANTNFGLATQKQGQRILEFGAKFSF
jgi:Carboxypeptidase regulatory-like domain